MPSRRKVLVVGSGGREHALAHRLLASESVGEVLVAPGNAGTAGAAPPGKAIRNVTGKPLDVAKAERPDLVVVGPEAPLTEGIVDALAAEGIVAFGPSKSAARLEGSKAFMKDFVRRAGILTARHEVVAKEADLRDAVRRFQSPPVVKADGLCAGKGVVVAETHEEAVAAGAEMLRGDRFGDAGRVVVLEERILGAEASVHAISDGERVFVLPSAQDHKRIGDGDTGPNTGGMGTYAPAPLVTPALAERVRVEVFERTVRAMAAEGNPYKGVLFAGLMVTDAGEPYLLEFNVRFGDPETEVLMNVLDGDLADALHSAAKGLLDPAALSVSARHALSVVVASEGYPGTPRLGDAILGLGDAAAVPEVVVYHAGTRLEDGRVVTAGGRVLAVTGRGCSLREAHARAYAAVEKIRFPGMQYRRDIGARALG
ncbi:MAG TPA: phosphoribosylamine--glycine ligase [Polyangiaceae bacterium]|nr:phosphoribosylamine--glycine ligase [Polyangiaceae bacterium]